MVPVRRHILTYLAGATLSYIGTAAVPVALSFAVLETGQGADALGIVLAAQTAPTIILLLLGGVAGDRWPRRRIMIGADLFRAAAQTGLAASLISGHASLVLMIAAAAAIGAGNAFFQPASGGFLTEIVPRAQLGRINGLLRTANALAMVIGPGLGGAAVLALGPGWGIALDAASYGASALCLLTIRTPASPAPAAARQSVWREVTDAARALRRTRWLGLVVVQFGLLNMLAIAPFNVIAPAVLARGPAGAGAWGTLLSAIGMGAIAGAFGCARWQPPRMLLAIEAAAALLAAPIMLLAIGAPFPVVVAGSVLFGAGAAMLSVLTITAIQRDIPPALLSRVMAVVQLAGMGLNPAGYLLAGPAMALLGAGTTLALSGACVLGSVAILCRLAAYRHVQHGLP